MTKAGERILKSVREARAYARGEQVEGLVVHRDEELKARIAALPEEEALPDEIEAIKAGRQRQRGRNKSTKPRS